VRAAAEHAQLGRRDRPLLDRDVGSARAAKERVDAFGVALERGPVERLGGVGGVDTERGGEESEAQPELAQDEG